MSALILIGACTPHQISHGHPCTRSRAQNTFLQRERRSQRPACSAAKKQLSFAHTAPGFNAKACPHTCRFVPAAEKAEEDEDDLGANSSSASSSTECTKWLWRSRMSPVQPTACTQNSSQVSSPSAACFSALTGKEASAVRRGVSYPNCLGSCSGAATCTPSEPARRPCSPSQHQCPVRKTQT